MNKPENFEEAIEIKRDPEDFSVEEIADIEPDPNGKYTIIKARVRDWDTNRIAAEIARRLHMSRKRVTFAGTKDKRAVKLQYFCINSADVDVASLSGIKDFEVIESFKSSHYLTLGDLIANHFKIRFYGIDPEMFRERYVHIISKGGFPNFFGDQRFGSRRRNTHEIGKLIIKGEYEEAVKKYIYDEKYDKESYRKHFIDTLDYKTALERFPHSLSFERSLIGYYARNGTFKGAFDSLPKNLTIMFVHAYQSYLFNRILDERLKIYGLNAVLPGDIAFPVDAYFNPDKSKPIEVNSYNREKISKLVSSDKIRISLPIFGYKTWIDNSDFGDVEYGILKEEGISQDDFKNKDFAYLSSSGDRRIISAKPINFSLENNVVEFTLGKGIYATVFLSSIGRLKENVYSDSEAEL
ncbi:hypothetical protein [Thermoplasma volcanium GSS1]|uniref:Probable tRNA pseudouridine synthase D n=1 Tax=Thermoplasma volcanium (strain ATCC 51530 / DSM 4299 / JCM 9571 / NBRC 15438 / GSS1) TaxID=273116 RepID=TRUD_THEVO|nr:tRNA pseudouridine(13) synthase TruD [Thermoplasma volcanium]Q978K9.1 RecName: Full=Probable tRNA pseudouridine synthase D; AltName: Full=tRNA pseudouridine(13) synthase; AltName: Full=tRNA pseudouridylate synthase D; AltName: Full=tRNA-uridine isomerase D [Thermoplasma volcanium GSS1]BAB60548.1 hypothetical protein [Thermoplasma volcanium GSS1]